MRTALHRHALVGVHHGQAFPETSQGDGPIIETLEELAKDDFFDAVAVGKINDPVVRRAAGELLASAGMRVSHSVGAIIIPGQLNLNALEESSRRHAVEMLLPSIDDAYTLGAVQLNVISGPTIEGEEREAALRALSRSLTELCEGAASQGELEIVLDIIDRKIERKGLVGSTVDAVQVAEAVRSRVANFGVTVDLSHLPMLEEGLVDSVRSASPSLVNVHLGNCYLAEPGSTAYGDAHPRFGYPGSLIGEVEVAEFLSELREIGYLKPGGRRPVLLNVRPQPGERGQTILANAKRVLHRSAEMAFFPSAA